MRRLTRLHVAPISMALCAVVLTIALFGHAAVIGTLLPTPDPTPAQAEHERYHHRIGNILFDLDALAWGVTLILAVASAAQWAFRWKNGS